MKWSVVVYCRLVVKWMNALEGQEVEEEEVEDPPLETYDRIVCVVQKQNPTGHVKSVD